MEDLVGALKELNCVVSNFPVGAESTKSVDYEGFDKLERSFNAKKGDLYLTAAYKEDYSDSNSQATCSSSTAAMQDYLKEKYIKECRELGLRGVVEMLSLESATVNAEGEGGRKYAEIKRKLMKLSCDILEVSEEVELDNQKLYEEMVSKEMKLLELMHKCQEAAWKFKEKRDASPDALAVDERLEQRTRSLLDKVNFMKILTVNLIASSGAKLSENPDIVELLINRCQPIQYEYTERL